MTVSPRSVLLVAHTGRQGNAAAAQRVARRLQAAGVEVRVLSEESHDIGLEGVRACPFDHTAADGVEVVLVLGGDGSILRAAELARGARVPLLGVNLGRVGFLAAAESEDLDETVEVLLDRAYTVRERLTLDVSVLKDGREVASGWALNEASVGSAARERMLEVVVEVDGRPLSRWGCDGVVAATPTGSTAYAFSAGGPVIWPGVEAYTVVPISAHALFARPLVLAPTTVVALEVLPSGADAVLACDGRRVTPLPSGARVEIRRGKVPVLLARTRQVTFTDTLVDKFRLPVEGWRGAAEQRTD
ncbi:MAG: ATP-NAD/AcoX kinase [Frankiales bacterium]|nr:ATP-NAD/AcoX kinase [Frankiales bacterium]